MNTILSMGSRGGRKKHVSSKIYLIDGVWVVVRTTYLIPDYLLKVCYRWSTCHTAS